MTETMTNAPTDAVDRTPAADVRRSTAGPNRPPRRPLLAPRVTQGLLLALVAILAFGVGYLTSERQGMLATQQALELRVAAQERIGDLEREVMELRMARLEAESRRAAIVEVDLDDVFTHLRERIIHDAAAAKTALAADVSSKLTDLFTAEPPASVSMLDPTEATGPPLPEPDLVEAAEMTAESESGPAIASELGADHVIGPISEAQLEAVPLLPLDLASDGLVPPALVGSRQ